jgi:hypothetical protein
VKAESCVQNKVITAKTMKMFRVKETLKIEVAYYSEMAINMHQNT